MAVPVVMVANGPGPKLAGHAVDAAKENASMDGLISTGFCGGLKPALRACDIFIATEVSWRCSGAHAIQFAAIPSGEAAVDRSRSIYSRRKGRAEQERGCGGDGSCCRGGTCDASGVFRFTAVRVVTDTSEEDFPLDFNRMRSEDGRFSRAKIIAAALRSPATVFPELIKLNKRTKRAAQALGDFLADARF